ncbi:HAD family hydrolase [Paenibacillus sp. sgz500958]|uniref:HAD family hydrolase n=1 Tax=Paenibacillus sp. sgz500958 TaxID=3242475 RepID=UPI0036D2372B
MKKFTNLLFDLDNTLMDRDYTFRSFCTQFVQDFLSHLDPTEAGQVVEDMIVRDADGYRDKDGYFAELSEVLPWSTPVSAAEIRVYYDTHYESHGAIMKHAMDILNYCLEQGYTLGLVTNGKVPIQHAKIDLLQLRPYFKDIVISEEVGISKPDPEIYQLALKRLGADSSNTLFIGDHPVNDIWGAGQAGMKGIWLRRKHEWDEKLGLEPWRMIHELDELRNIL